MKKRGLFIGTLFLGIITFSCRSREEWRPLFNGENLENWDCYLGPAFPGLETLAKKSTVENVFSVVEQDGEKLMRISGEVHGSIATRESFENYHLRLVYRWGDYVPHECNSGLLYHSHGPFGASYWTWMASIECQLMHGNPGDTYMMVENLVCETAVERVERGRGIDYVYDPAGVKTEFGEPYRRRMIRKSENAENPLGQWNTVELYCFGQTAVHVINGRTVMVNENLGIYKEDTIRPLTGGRIQLQSEGAELFVKTLEIRSIQELPRGIITD